MLKEEDEITFKGFKSYKKVSSSSDGRAIGGVAILIHAACYHQEIKLNTPLQAIAIQISLYKPVTICSIYLPSSQNVTVSLMDNLISQLPSPLLLLGDFNAHHQLWGCLTSNARGDMFEEFFNSQDLCLLNNKSITYISPATGTSSAIDLSLCSPSIFLDWEWKVKDDQCGSDHFPIIIQILPFINPDKPSCWQLHRADWQYFKIACTREINRVTFSNIEQPMDVFTSCLIEITKASVPKSSTKPKHIPKPWFDESCQEAVKKRKLALRRFKRQPTQENLLDYRQKTAQARRIIKIKKKESWKHYVSKLNIRSSVKKTWQMIRKISGKNSSPPLYYLRDSQSNTIVKDPLDISNVLGQEFSKNSSSSHYSEQFQQLKIQSEKSNLNFSSKNLENYNSLFTMEELKVALRRANDTAIGPDDIHYQLLKHLPDESLLVLLDAINHIWCSGNLPKIWKQATIIPIPKPNKDHCLPSNYRPIALTSCLCKTMERMINDRLVWFLEEKSLITKFQSGFRKQRCTLDHLIRLETFIRDGFIRGNHVVSVFFDLEKAYDTTWKYGIMRDLHGFGLRGRLPIFIREFLNERSFKVRIGSSFSDPFVQEMGVPQGSILSVTLFSVKINDIVNSASSEMNTSLFVDDFSISYSSKYMPSIERQLQLNLSKIQKWADTNGFKFSPSKTVCVHFCQKRGLHPDPSLSLYGQEIPVVDKVKFLGIFFDKKLNFKYHIDYLRSKCLKSLNLLRVLSKKDWGADREVLLRLYRSLVRSKIDYGSFIYGSARPSYLKRLHFVQNQALRLCLGAFRTSPMTSLHVEAGEYPMHFRREKLALQYALRLSSNPGNPAFDAVFNNCFHRFYLNKPNAIPNVALRLQGDLRCICPDTQSVANYRILRFPPWQLMRPKIDVSLSTLPKSKTDPLVYLSNYSNLRDEYCEFDAVFTDGSKNEDGVAAAAICGHFFIQMRLPNNASVFTAELYAIRYALDFIEDSLKDKFIIFSDSLSSLQALSSSDFRNPLVASILEKCHNVQLKNKQVVLAWCPGHVGISGNERADCLARKAIRMSVTQVCLPQSDFRPVIQKLIKRKWQRQWDEAPDNKLYTIQSTVDSRRNHSRRDRREEVVLARLRIGHTYYTHKFLFDRDPVPICIPCDEILSVKHMLIDCIDFQIVRNRFYSADTLENLFKNIDPNLIFEFLKEIGLYHRL